jgi:hypothetical protein
VAGSARIAIATTVLVVEAHRQSNRQVGFLFWGSLIAAEPQLRLDSLEGAVAKW